jgi:hypothetical protein
MNSVSEAAPNLRQITLVEGVTSFIQLGTTLC